MAPTSAKSTDKTIYEGLSTIALGILFSRMLNATSNWSDGRVLDDRLSFKYFELKYGGLHYI
jgi:hypothetical protein